MGDRPTHPELLDWLATEFVHSGWSMKHMHRLIMTSATYQQSSDFRKDAAETDPGNRLLWAFPRHRLEGEVIRDSSLHGGRPAEPEDGRTQRVPRTAGRTCRRRAAAGSSPAPEERNRRSVYIFVRRNTRYPMLEAFDMPDTHESCSRRDVTTTAPQALTMLNDKVALEWAQAFAGARAGGPGPAGSRLPPRLFPAAGCLRRRTPRPRSSTSRSP